jgi:LacI family transcriptional regulator
MSTPEASGSPERGRRRPNGIKVVAQIAGVSIGTVSNVLNQPAKVSEATRIRVEAVMDRIGFVRNSAAASVRRGQSQLIGLVVPDITNPFFAEVARGAVDAAFAAGYVLVLCNSEGQQAREAKYLTALEEQRAAGVLLNPVGKLPADIERLRSRGTRVIMVDRAAPVGVTCSASVDDILGGQLAVEHLIAAGSRSIVMVNGPVSLRQCADRRRGARRAIKKAGLPESTLTEIISPVMTISGGVEAALSALRRRPDVDGVFCANDLLAIGACRALQAVRPVPEQVVVVGYDDIPIAEEAPVPLTSVSQPKYDLGRAAVDLLLAELRADGEHRHQHVSFTPELVVRRSSDTSGRDLVGAKSARGPQP